MLEADDYPSEEDQQLPAKACRIWVGAKKPLTAKLINGQSYQKTTTVDRGNFVVLYLNDGTQKVYNLNRTPVFIEYRASIRPEQPNLKTAALTIEQANLGYWIPHEITHVDNRDSRPCREVFSTPLKPTFSERVKLIAQNHLRPFGDKLHRVFSRFKLI